MPSRPRRSGERLNAVDLFCGAGGLSYAFYRKGFNIVLAVEKDANAAASYRSSFIEGYSRSTELLEEDICAPLVTKRLKQLKKELNKPIDVVIGGPPCQDFSPARLKARRDGRRAGLVRRYFEIIKILRPRTFMFENVPNLLKAGRGKYWAGVEEAAAELGYTVTAKELHAEQFGVPQRRRRLIVVGNTQEDPIAMPNPKRKAARTVMEVIGSLPALKAGEASDDPMHKARNHRDYMVEYFSQIPQGGGWRDASRRLPCQNGHNGHYDTYGRMRGDKIAPTLTGGCTNPSKGRFIHPTQDRGLTVREAALLQTFPADWFFDGGIESQSLQVGNAVPIKFGEAIAERLRRHLS